MKLKLLFTVALCAATTTFAAREIKYLQWNIGHFSLGKYSTTTVTKEQSAKRAAEYKAIIDKLNPDVIGVSEYSAIFDKAKNNSTNMIFSAFPVATIGPARHYQWNATFSRNLQFVSSSIVEYAKRHQKVYYIDSIYRIDGKEVHIVQSHLDWQSLASRTSQIQQLIDAFKDKPYVIISADFNAYADEEYKPFEKAGFNLVNCGKAGSLITYPVKAAPGKKCEWTGCLDNIVCKGFKPTKVFIEDKEWKLSDHRILGATLIMQ